MKFSILFYFMCALVVACNKGNDKPIIKKQIVPEEFLKMVMKTKEVYWNEDSVVPEKIVLLSKSHPWPAYAFHIPDSIIPREKETAEKFFTDENGVYKRHYVFRDKKLSAALRKQDQKFMRQQGSASSKEWKFSNSDQVTVIDSLQDKKFDRRYVYSQPVFSEDSTFALVKKLVYWRSKDCVADCETGNVSETTHYFEQVESGKWKYFGGSGAVE